MTTILLSLCTLFAGPTAAPKVVTTLPFLASITREVAGDLVTVDALADPRWDPHTVEPRPTLMAKAREADVFVEVGLQLELWAEKVVSGSGNTAIQSGQPGRIIASTGVQTLELPQTLSREWGDVHPYGNPHIWLDPLNAKDIAANIAAGLARVDPAHAADYTAGAERFSARIDQALFGADLVDEVGGAKLTRLARQGRLHDYLEARGLADRIGGWLAKAASLRGQAIVTYHKTMIYFTERFGLTIPVEIEEKPGIPPSARHRDHVVDVIEAQHVHAILEEVYYDRTAADYLAAQTGAMVVITSIDVGEAVGNADYFALIDHLIDGLLAAAGGSTP